MSADASALCAFAAATFTATYGSYNHPENLQRHLDAAFGLRQQTAELADPCVTTLLAHIDNQLVAYAQVRRAAIPACIDDEHAIELQRFYVEQRWHGRGISQRLFARVSEAAAAFAGTTLWLKVWENNARAIAFYTKAGMVDVGTADFFVGSDRQTDRVLALTLAHRRALDPHNPHAAIDTQQLEDRS